jgi:hypothetical protein
MNETLKRLVVDDLTDAIFPGLPDFSWYMISKCTKQMVIKDPKSPSNIPICINISTFSNLRPSKIYSNGDFCLENEPSGNPACFCKQICTTKGFPEKTEHTKRQSLYSGAIVGNLKIF